MYVIHNPHAYKTPYSITSYCDSRHISSH